MRTDLIIRWPMIRGEFAPFEGLGNAPLTDRKPSLQQTVTGSSRKAELDYFGFHWRTSFLIRRPDSSDIDVVIHVCVLVLTETQPPRVES